MVLCFVEEQRMEGTWIKLRCNIDCPQGRTLLETLDMNACQEMLLLPGMDNRKSSSSSLVGSRIGKSQCIQGSSHSIVCIIASATGSLLSYKQIAELKNRIDRSRKIRSVPFIPWGITLTPLKRGLMVGGIFWLC